MRTGQPEKKRPPHSLKVKCSSWDHVEAFYSRKLHDDNHLSMRVPFNIDMGAKMVLALELPNEMVMAIDAAVISAVPAADNKKCAIKLKLHGMTPEVLGRLKTLVADARKGHKIAEARAASASRDPSEVEPPVAMPADAPVDEVVLPPMVPRIEDVVVNEREVFITLDNDLRRMREAAAHEVLGVDWDVGVAQIRSAYFGQTKCYHPDIFSKYKSSAIKHLAQEVFIHINKAYDRMRDAAVADGAAIVAGPALLPHDGWLADFDDIGEEPVPPLAGPLPAHEPSGPIPVVRAPSGPMAAGRKPASRMPPPTPPRMPPPRTPASLPEKPLATRRGEPSASEPVVRFSSDEEEKPLTEDTLFGDIDLGSQPDMRIPVAPEDAGGAVTAECRELLTKGDFKTAQVKLAAALRVDPRNRQARALYHVATGRALLEKGEAVQATAQFEAALAHNRDCEEASRALENLRKTHAKRGGLFRRLFK